MTLSLTKEEFLKRLNERAGKGGILEIAIKYDLNKSVNQKDFVATAAAEAIFRVVDAVYDESF